MKDFQKILNEAEALGLKKYQETEEDNYCGMSYITGIDGKSEFINFVKKNFTKDNDYTYSKGNIRISKGVYKGYDLFVHFGPTQSLTKKEQAVLEVCVYLQDNGIKCRQISRAL